VWDVRLAGACHDCETREGCPHPHIGCLHLAGWAGNCDGAHERLARLPIDAEVVGPLVDAGAGGEALHAGQIPSALAGPWVTDPLHTVLIAFPLELGGEQVGAMALFSEHQPAEQDLSLLQSLARFTAAAIENARRYEQLEDLVEKRTRTLEDRNRQLRLQSAELEQAYRHKSEFLAVMSHELRTPLTSIIGFANLLTDHIGDALTDRQRDALGRIERNGQDLLYLINQILDYSKIEAGKMRVSVHPIALEELLRDVLSRLEPQAAAKGLELELRIPTPLASIDSDSHRLRQVLGNLLSNAVKFTASGTVTLSADVHEPFLHLSVTDTGPGIALHQLPSIFEEFRQADGSSTRGAGGTGLGLAICRRLSRLLGGELRVASRPGEGSCFSAVLPLHAEPTPAEAALKRGSTIAPPAESIENRRVLIVDDDEAASYRMADHLARAGFELVMARSVGEAVESAGSQVPTAIVTELLLPQSAGWDLVRQVRSRPELQTVPIIVVGIVDDPDVAPLCGAVAYLLKPVDLVELEAYLEGSLVVTP